jgi:hypothetical protein
MNNETQAQTIDVKSLILTVRGTQVLLDSDVAMLYGYETRAINQTASRNKDRFPGSFRFQLTRGEFDGIEAIRVQSVAQGPLLEDCQNLISQTVTSSSKGYGGRRKLPYVYAEEGIAR